MSLSYSSLIGYTGHLGEATRHDEVVTYNFSIDSTPDNGYSDGYYIGSSRDVAYIYNHTEEQYSFITGKIEEIDGLIDLDLVEVSIDAEADLTFHRSWYNTEWERNSTPGIVYLGTTYYKSDGADLVWFDYYSRDSFTDDEKHTITHELLHGLGLGHPDDSGFNPAWDSGDSVMSYNGDGNGTLSTLDINALHSIWGVEDDNGAENTINDYIASNPDLIEAIGNNPDEALSHYYNFGITEGRAFDSFDEFGYLASNSDLISAYGSDAEAATNHFIEFGVYEGRSDDLFNAQAYGSANPDVYQAFGGDSDLMTRHYIENGIAEGRSIS